REINAYYPKRRGNAPRKDCSNRASVDFKKLPNCRSAYLEFRKHAQSVIVGTCASLRSFRHERRLTRMSGNATARATACPSIGRRRVLCAGASLMFFTVTSGIARAAPNGRRRLSLYNPHTDERFDDVYWCDGAYVATSRKRIEWLMRDFHRDAVAPI